MQVGRGWATALLCKRGMNMGCYYWGDDEWRECDDCPYFSECPESDDNKEDGEV